MKKFAMLLAVVSVVALVAGVALTEIKADTISGTLAKVDGKTLVLKVDYKDKDGKAATVELKYDTNDKTEFMLDGKASKLDDMKADMKVTITQTPNQRSMAAKVEATSPAK